MEGLAPDGYDDGRNVGFGEGKKRGWEEAVTAMQELTDEMINRGSRARVAVCRKMPSALTLEEYAAPDIIKADRLGMREACQAMITALEETK